MTQDIQKRLAIIAGMDRQELNDSWKSIFGYIAPRSTHLNLLRGALAWQAQVNPRLEKRLSEALRQWSAKAASAKLKPGTLLIREWNGERHEVLVTEEGYLHQGQLYKSLSAVARAITHMVWSGPQFFGLRK